MAVIEYTHEGFDAACDGFGARLAVVRRDVEVTTPESADYVFDRC